MNTEYANLRRAILMWLPLADTENVTFVRVADMARVNEIPEDVVRAILKDARRRGWVRIVQGYDADEGKCRGTGYGLTTTGHAAVFAEPPLL